MSTLDLRDYDTNYTISFAQPSCWAGVGWRAKRCRAAARRRIAAQAAENKSARPEMAPALFGEQPAATVGRIRGD
jgi:hypothetical protein